MEAKDTVVHADGCTTNLGVIGAICNCGAEAQAEISFKVGIQKVVGWVENHGGVMEFINMHYGEAWQAMLKEWKTKT